MPEIMVKARVTDDDATRAVRKIGKELVANKIEQIVYSCVDMDELLVDLHSLVQWVRA